MKQNALSALGRRTAPPAISWLMKTALARPKLISLAAGFTDNSTLPVEISRKLLNDILRSPKTGQPALQYGITAGEMNLRTLTAKHLQKLDGGNDRAHSPEHVIITGGSQQLLYMTLEALCDEGDIILVENPTYFVFLSILQSRGLKARGVKLERDGLDLVHLEKVLTQLKKTGELRRVKALYLITYFQNPTGATTSLAKKSAALALLKKFERAAGHPIYLLEDAAYRELRFDHGEDVPTALTLPGAAVRVIYTGTYSKPFAPGARLGFGILPEPLFTAVQRIKGNHDFGTANLLQQLLAGALATGLYDRHVAKVQKNYARKARVMKSALAEHFPANVEIWESGGGLYFWARLPKGISAGVNSKVFSTAMKNDVLYVPGELCYADDPARAKPDNEMRISFGSASEENIRKGIARLGAVLKKFVR
ncbi:MAG TPA: PLP-dependent aminotransferase family protein [Candidatus Limnocylindrales bacterium]|nr:PLP-dependent aminotransferase family protein [Candidatus Limnocylindrales bacterium]